MKKNNHPELVEDILRYEDCMSDQLRRAEQVFFTTGILPDWAKGLPTDGWRQAVNELNDMEFSYENNATEMARICLFRDLAERYLRSDKIKRAKARRKRKQAQEAKRKHHRIKKVTRAT